MSYKNRDAFFARLCLSCSQQQTRIRPAPLPSGQHRSVTHHNLSLRAIGNDYFAREAHHHLLVEAAVFCLLMLTAVLPLVNGASAIVGLLRSVGAAS
jgi:hypothetical protein